MEKDKIFISKIEKEYTIARGQDKVINKITGLYVTFDYSVIVNAMIKINTKQNLSEEEIKDKIVEVMQ